VKVGGRARVEAGEEEKREREEPYSRSKGDEREGG